MPPSRLADPPFVLILILDHVLVLGLVLVLILLLVLVLVYVASRLILSAAAGYQFEINARIYLYNRMKPPDGSAEEEDYLLKCHLKRERSL